MPVIACRIAKPSPARKIDPIAFMQTKRQFKTDFIATYTKKYNDLAQRFDWTTLEAMKHQNVPSESE